MKKEFQNLSFHKNHLNHYIFLENNTKYIFDFIYNFLENNTKSIFYFIYNFSKFKFKILKNYINNKFKKEIIYSFISFLNHLFFSSEKSMKIYIYI